MTKLNPDALEAAEKRFIQELGYRLGKGYYIDRDEKRALHSAIAQFVSAQPEQARTEGARKKHRERAIDSVASHLCSVDMTDGFCSPRDGQCRSSSQHNCVLRATGCIDAMKNRGVIPVWLYDKSAAPSPAPRSVEQAAPVEVAGVVKDDTYPTPEHGWVCFHCGEHFPGDFAGSRRARDHFGWLPNATPVCVLSKEDRGLLRALRSAEHQRDNLKADNEAQSATIAQLQGEVERLTKEHEEYLEEEHGVVAEAITAQRAAEERADKAEALLNTPELHDFTKAVALEGAHQRERWGSDHDAGKTPADWFWLVGYLAGKALHSINAGNTDKALHHIITTAAALANWHAAVNGDDNRMRPGIEPPAALPPESAPKETPNV